jgi:hypothetical protein
VKPQYKNLNSRIMAMLFCISLLVPFQNCAVYKSEGRKAFESSVAKEDNKGCYPYIDTNLAMQYLNSVDGSLNVYMENIASEGAVACDFWDPNILLTHVNCKVSQGNAELALMLKQQGMDAFDNTTKIWDLNVTAGFSGATHGGYVTLDDDGLNTIRFLAVDGAETRGVGCSVRLTPTDYTNAAAAVQNAIGKITYEMAINNQK